MRLRHPKILEIVVSRDDLPATIISHVWCEIFKWYGSGKPKHPKMFINDDFYLGIYLRCVYEYGVKKGCRLNQNKISSLGIHTQLGFANSLSWSSSKYLFDNNNLFSDLVSLYYKGYNLFPDVFGDTWEKYCPVISHKEIQYQVSKTLNPKINRRMKIKFCLPDKL